MLPAWVVNVKLEAKEISDVLGIRRRTLEPPLSFCSLYLKDPQRRPPSHTFSPRLREPIFLIFVYRWRARQLGRNSCIVNSAVVKAKYQFRIAPLEHSDQNGWAPSVNGTLCLSLGWTEDVLAYACQMRQVNKDFFFRSRNEVFFGQILKQF